MGTSNYELDLFDPENDDCEIEILTPTTSTCNQNLIYKGDKWDTVFEVLKTNEDLQECISEVTGEPLSKMYLDAVIAIRESLLKGMILSLGFSGGKDSSATLHLMLCAMVSLIREGKRAQISPYHWVSHTDTLVENPEIRNLADEHLDALNDFIAKENLPLTVVIGRPSLTRSWTGRILTGRGLPTYVTSNAPQCSIDLKVSTAKQVKSIMVKRIPKELRGNVCLLLGSRDAESVARAGNIAKRGGADTVPVKTKDGYELYPIKRWGQYDVWETLLRSGSGPSEMLCLPGYLPDNNELASVYREATGECIWSASEKKVTDSCGARFGCWVCQRGGGTDKSMETMLYEVDDEGNKTVVERYAYMVNLNKIQRFLAVKQWDWNLRHPIGRTIYAGGFIKITPDVFAPSFLERLLHVCCSADYVEQMRADNLKLKLLFGEVENNAYNRRMSKPQFRIVSPAQLIHICFLWGFHQFNSRPFRAIEIYRSVWEDGILDLLEGEDLETPVPKTPQPPSMWLDLGAEEWSESSLTDGICDPMATMTYFDGQDSELAATTVNTFEGPRKVVSMATSQELEIDQDAANWVIWQEYPRFIEDIEAGFINNTAATTYLLRMGVVSLSPGAIARMHNMAQRGQKLAAMRLTGDQSLYELFCRPDLGLVSEKTYFDRVSALLKRKYKKAVRLWTIGFLIELHRFNSTSLARELDAMVEKERKAQRSKTLIGLANSLESKITTILSIRAEWLIDPEAQRLGKPLLRRFRRSVNDSLRALNLQEAQDVRLHLDVLLEQLQVRVLTGNGLSYSDVLADAIAVSPATVNRMIKVYRRMLAKSVLFHGTDECRAKKQRKKEKVPYVLPGQIELAIAV